MKRKGLNRGGILLAGVVALAGTVAIAPLSAQSMKPADDTATGQKPADTAAGQVPADPAPGSGSETAGGIQFHVAGGVATDYRFRSISQTRRDPFVYGLVSAEHGDFYARVGGENVDFGDGTDAEYDLYVGWAPRVGKTRFDVGVVRYGYIGAPRGIGRDTVEYKAAVTHTIGKGWVGGQAYYAPDFLTYNTAALYTEANAGYAVTPRLTINGVVGVEQIHRFDDFTVWNLGGTYALTKAVGLDVRYFDTDSHDAGTIFHSAVVAAIKVAL